MSKLRSWGIRRVQKLLSDVAFDPTNDGSWSVVGQGVSSDYFLGRAIEHIRLMKETEDQKRNFVFAMRYLIMWFAKENP